jgi:hypothetical protein
LSSVGSGVIRFYIFPRSRERKRLRSCHSVTPSGSCEFVKHFLLLYLLLPRLLLSVDELRHTFTELRNHVEFNLLSGHHKAGGEGAAFQVFELFILSSFVIPAFFLLVPAV